MANSVAARDESLVLGRRLRRGTWMQPVLRFVRNKPLGAFGAALVFSLVFVAIIAPAIAPHGPKEFVGEGYEPATGLWNWGTDSFGRDVMSRVLWGTRLTLYVGLSSAFIGTFIGALWGLSNGYRGGSLYDTLSQRVVEAQMSVPTLILAMVILAVLAPSVNNVVLAIAFSQIPSTNRTIRSLALGLREKEYILAARAIGCSELRIILRHMAPNAFAIFIVLISLHVATAILSESSLSFLGVGVPPDEPSWGGLVNAGAKKVLSIGPLLALIPGLFITATVYGFNLFGDALRDVLDPRLRGSRGSN